MTEERGYKLFVIALRSAGISLPESKEYVLYKCVTTTGKRTAVAGAAVGVVAGNVTVPILGSVPGWVIGALAGFTAGTAACMTKDRLSELKVEIEALSNRIETIGGE